MAGVRRRDALAGVLAAGGMGVAIAARATVPARHDPDSTFERLVDPDLRAFVGPLLAYEQESSPPSTAILATARAGYLATARPPLPSPPVEVATIPADAARRSASVTVRIVNRRAGARRPAILHLHGGGFVMGDAAIDLVNLQTIAGRLDVAIVSVAYRLAPETDWRGSLEDNHAALLWLHRNAASLGADPDRIALMGESAGGGHAALLAIAARDRGSVPIRFQCLVYPMLDDRTDTTVRRAAQMGHVGWSPAWNAFGWRAFLGRAPGGAATDGVPGRTADLSGLPPAWIGVGALDLFLDEDVDYVRRLADAGVATELLVVPGAFHGFDEVSRLSGVRPPVVARFEDAKLAALARWVGNPA